MENGKYFPWSYNLAKWEDYSVYFFRQKTYIPCTKRQLLTLDNVPKNKMENETSFLLFSSIEFETGRKKKRKKATEINNTQTQQ